ncbi:hypothetical protein FACS189459_4830 [Bacilli bacterium]|nr:hypothetical protein FACS189459_4830 [Bacilli bacterium]
MLRSIARNIGTDVSNQTLANDANISTNTVAEYLDVLKNIYIYEPLYSWNTHVRSSISLRTSPKKYFADPSLAISILNINSKKLINDYNFVGFLFESMVIRDLRIYAELIDAEIHYYRDNTGLEIDAIIELPDGT